MDPEPYFTLILLTGILKPFSISVLFSFIILLVLLIFSALISGSEVAFYSITPAQIADLRESEDKKDRSILKLLEKPRLLLATILKLERP